MGNRLVVPAFDHAEPAFVSDAREMLEQPHRIRIMQNALHDSGLKFVVLAAHRRIIPAGERGMKGELECCNQRGLALAFNR